MSDKSRKSDSGRAAVGGSATTPDGAGGSKKRRRRAGSTGGQSDGGFLQRHRAAVVGVIAVVAIGFVGFVLFRSATASAYTCDALLTAPQGATSASADENGRFGFVVEDAGRSHSESSLRYATCPPTSGDHRAGGALPRQYYGPASQQVPNDFVHNLEHGYAVIAYSGNPGAGVLAQIRTAMDAPAPTEVAESCGLPNKVIALRFDDMSEPFAVLAWDRALLMSDFEPELAARAAEQFQDQPQAPERAC